MGISSPSPGCVLKSRRTEHFDFLHAQWREILEKVEILLDPKIISLMVHQYRRPSIKLFHEKSALQRLNTKYKPLPPMCKSLEIVGKKEDRQRTKSKGGSFLSNKGSFTHIWAKLGKGVSGSERSWSWFQNIFYNMQSVAWLVLRKANPFVCLRRGKLCLGMFWCIMFALWVWGTEKPHCEDNRE